jgi:hypothetical protein
MPISISSSEYNSALFNGFGGWSETDRLSFINTFFNSSQLTIGGSTYIASYGVDFNHNVLDSFFNGGLDTIDTTFSLGIDDARSIILENVQYVLPTKDELRESLLGATLPGDWGNTVATVWTASAGDTPDSHIALDQPFALGATVDQGDNASYGVVLRVIDLPTLSIVADANTVSEGETISFTVNTTNFTQGTSFQYTISGVYSDDISGVLNSFVTIGADGSAFITVDVLADRITEGDQILTVSIGSESASVTVMDQFIDPSQFEINSTDSIEDLESLTAGTGPLNTLVLPDGAGDVYFEFGEDGTGLLIPNDPTKWSELADAGSVTFNAGFNGIAAGSGDDSLFGSDAHSEVFAPGSFNEFGNIVYGGDDDENETVDYVDYRAESEFATQAVILVSESGVIEEREFNGVVLALEDNNGEDGFATVQRSADQFNDELELLTAGAFDEISSIEGVLGSLKNDLLDASQIGASGAVLAGFEGDDLLIGSDAKDVLVGGSGNDILVAGNELSGVNLLEGGLGKDTVVASGAKDLIFVRLGDDSGYGAISGSTSTAQEQVIDFQLSGDSAKFVGRDNLVKDEFLFVSDSTSVVTADFNNVTNSLSITSGSSSYEVAVDIKTESGTSTTSYYDAITQRIVDYTVSAFVVQGQPIINNTPDLSGALLAGSAYSSVLASTAESVTRVGLLRQRMGELIDKAGVADAVVGGRDDDIIVLSGKGSEIKGDLAIGGQGSDLYEVRMVSDLRSATDITAIEHDNITIREMGARGGSNNHDGIFIEGVKDIWSDISLSRSIDGKSLEIDYKQYTHNDLTDTYIQQSQGELNVYKQYDFKAPYYRVEKLALQDADDGTTTIFNLGMNAKAGTVDSTAGFKEKISAVEFDTSVSTDLEFDGENHWLVGSGKDIYDLSGLENDAVVMLTGFDTLDKLQLSDEYVYEYFDYEADGDLEALFAQAGIGGDNVLDTGRDGVLVVAQQDSTTGSPIDHWMILMSDSSANLSDQFQLKIPEMA